MRWFIPWIKKEDIGNGLTWLIPTLWENQSTFCSPNFSSHEALSTNTKLQMLWKKEMRRNWSWKRHRVAKPVTAEHRGWHDYESESKGWFQRPEMSLMNQSGKRNHMTTDIRKLIYRGKKKFKKDWQIIYKPKETTLSRFCQFRFYFKSIKKGCCFLTETFIKPRKIFRTLLKGCIPTNCKSRGLKEILRGVSHRFNINRVRLAL